VVSLRAEREQATALLRRDRWRLGIVIGVVLLAIAGLLVLAGGKPVPPGRSAYDAGTTDPVAAAVPVLAGYAEQARGLRFRRPPAVRVADAATVARAAAESTAVDSGGRALTDRALGFVGQPPTTSPVAAYSYRQHAVYLRQDQPVDAAARVALVHGLTLALQDQNADVAGLRRQAADDPDRTRALAALVEGDASRIELAYLASLPAGDQTAIRTRHDDSPSPSSYGELAAAFPTTAGRDFAAALAQQGGNPALDAAFRRPPTSTAQVIDPKAYQDGIEPLGVRAPAGEGQRVDAGTLGEFGLAALITGGRRATNAGGAGRWLGDSYGPFGPGGACAPTSTSCWRTASRASSSCATSASSQAGTAGRRWSAAPSAEYACAPATES
jgi:hypothetical protein